MKAKICFALAALALLLPSVAKSQTPVPVIVPAASSTATLPGPDNSVFLGSTLKLLQEIKATNDVTLKTQAAQLETLDELQKAAEEIKIYSKRG